MTNYIASPGTDARPVWPMKVEEESEFWGARSSVLQPEKEKPETKGAQKDHGARSNKRAQFGKGALRGKAAWKGKRAQNGAGATEPEVIDLVDSSDGK